ncbi:polymorphic toxin type 27 domain-containing protein [Streptomyces sp. NRRL S-87]|uniref:polymorphic toxin type 27 domain-containing protein n=1 Tax=Streptomyces sp. NRRL S-87 TaxID=1463920 RepID=UPI0004C1002E|nr:polymorphic toxin type 27 domain-containing protein [Streptomyces sp. NRRL S-87]
MKEALAAAGLSPEAYEQVRALAQLDLLDYLKSNGAEILVELFLEDIKACIDDPDIPTCLWAVVQNIGPAKAAKILGKLPRVAKAIAGINAFLDKTADARKQLKKYEEALGKIKAAASCLVDIAGQRTKAGLRRGGAAPFVAAGRSDFAGASAAGYGQAAGTAKVHRWKHLRQADGPAVNDRSPVVPAGVFAVPAGGPKKEGCLLADGDELVLGINGPDSGDALAEALQKETGKPYFTLNGGPWGQMSTADPNKPLWMVAVEEAAQNPKVNLTFSLDGLRKADGSEFETAEEALRYTVARGRTYTTPELGLKHGNQTAWELATVVRASILNETRELKDITWFWNGKRLNDPPAFDWRSTTSIDK